MGTKQAKGTDNSVVCCASAAPFRCRHKKPGWCDVNCEGAGLSLAVLAPLADIPQRKSLNSSEKVIGGVVLVRESLVGKRMRNLSPRAIRQVIGYRAPIPASDHLFHCERYDET
jgi:hypothetical protein